MKNILIFTLAFLSLPIFSRDFTDADKNTQANFSQTNRINSEEVKLIFPTVLIENLHQSIRVQVVPANHSKLIANNYQLNAIVNGKDQLLSFNENGLASFELHLKKGQNLNFILDDFSYSSAVPVTPIGWIAVPGAILILMIAYGILQKVKIKKHTLSKPAESEIKTGTIRITEVKTKEEAFI